MANIIDTYDLGCEGNDNQFPLDIDKWATVTLDEAKKQIDDGELEYLPEGTDHSVLMFDGYWILEYDDNNGNAQYYTVANREATKGTFEECVNLLNSMF